MKKGDSLKLSLPTDLEYLRVAVNFIRETAKLIGFGKEDTNKIELAADEAISNVMEHAFGDERGVFDLICEHTSLGIRIKIKDKGIPFDPLHVRPPDLEDLGNAAITGLGLHIIKASMDEIFFNNLGTEGKEIQLIKYLPTKNIEDYFGKEELAIEKQVTQKPEKAEKIEFFVRRMQTSEAIEVSRCAYKSHGYTFFDDHIYQPEHLVQLNETEDMISAVAVTQDGVFMGHLALVYPYPAAPAAEITYAFVNPEYREQGCVVKIADYLFNCPKKHPLHGVYAFSVTNHDFTQRGTVKFGIHDCALLLATSPQKWHFKGISDDNPQRMSVVLSFKYLEKTLQPLMIYGPPHHLEMIKKLYVNINGPLHTFAMPDCKASILPEKKAEIVAEILSTENCAKLQVVSYGTDVLIEVRKILRSLCLKSISAIQILLNLEDPLTYAMTAEFEKMGFFFAGILPMAPNGDGLLLQYLNNVDMDYDKLALYTPMAKEIRDYIKIHDPNIYL